MKRSALGRESIIGRVFGAVMIAGFIFFIRDWEPTLFSLIIIVLSAGIVADVLARYLAGKSSWHILVAGAVVVFADFLFFVVFKISA